MHPADVAEHVAVSVDLLRERLARRPELLASEPFLESAIDLFIPFTLRTRATVTTAIPSGLVAPGGQRFGSPQRIVDLAARPVETPLLLAMELADYDGQPPTAELLLPDRSPLPKEQWPGSLNWQGVILEHHKYDRPWFCRPGLREYHTHPQHDDDPWDAHREGLPLHTLVENLLDDLTRRFIAE